MIYPWKWCIHLSCWLFFPTPWLFDSLENVLVLKDSVFQSLSYGETDSTRELILNTGDTLIFSQKFGIIRFPDGYGTQQYYQQIGITGPEKGFRFPEPKQIFSFSIGDKFEYITSNINPLTYPYNAKTVAEAYKIHQIEILDSVHLPEAIAYKTRNKILIESGSCREGYWVPGFPNGACKQFLNSNQDHFTSGPNEEDSYSTGTYEIDVQICDSVSWDTVYFSMDQEFSINFLSQYREEAYADIWKSPQIQLSYLYPGELSYLTADSWGSWREGFTDHNYSFPAYTKKPYGKIAGRMNWRSCFNSLKDEKVDSVSCYYIDYGSTGYYMVDWEENLGITRAIWNPYGVEHRFVVSTNLSAYQTQFHAKGEFSPDSIFCYNPAPVREVDGMVPYPNPASGRFSVGPFSSPRSIFVTIHNLQGVELYRNQFTIEWRWDFSLEDYLPGVYMVNIWDFEEKAWSRTRLVVQ